MALTAAEVQKYYIGFYGRPADPVGLAYWMAQDAATALAGFSASAEYTNLYSGLTTEQRVAQVYQNVLGRTADVPGLLYWSGQLVAGNVTIANLVTTMMTNALGKDVTTIANRVTYAEAFTTALDTTDEIINYSGTAASAAARTALTAVVASAVGDTASLDTALAAVNTSITTVTGAGATSAGQTFTLTTGVDSGTAFTGGSGNDTFSATATGTFNALDSLDGAAGNADTLNVLDNGGNIATAGRVVKNIEIATLRASGTVTADTTGWTGLTTLTAEGTGGVNVTAAKTTTITATNTGANAMAIVGGGGDSSFTTGGAAVDVGQTAVANAFTSVTVTGGTTVAIADNLGNAVATTAATSGDTLKTVTVDGATGNVDITAKGLTAINATELVTDGQTVTNTDIDTAHALALTLNGVDSSADGAVTGGEAVNFVDAEATSVAIAAVTAASYDVVLTAAKATAVTVAAAVDLQVSTLTAGVATTLGISGAGKTTIAADTLAATAVVTSTSTGGVTLTQALTADQQYVGSASSGVDTIGVATAFTKAITTGAGNDVITYAGPATGGTIDAGAADTDTIVMTGAVAATATANSTFAGTVSNFEVLKLSAATGAARTINMANADGINHLSIAGATVGALAVTNAAANFTLTQTALTSFASSVALAVDTGDNDTVNLAFSAADGFTNSAAFTIANVENLVVTTDDTDTTATTAVFVTPITAAAVKTVTVTGDAGISFIGGLTGTALTSLDASGLTGTGAVEGLTWTSGALAASSNIKGSATGDNTVIFSAANTASTFVTYTGGSGADVVTGSNGLNNVVSLGNGTNSYTQVGAGDATVTGGTGADTITVGTGANTVNLGGGTTANSITVGEVSVGVNTITTTSTGVDTYVQGDIQSAAGYYSSLTGWTAGDELDFSGVVTSGSADGALGAKITLGGAANFANYLDAAAAATTAATTAAFIKWFQFGGNTYVVVDNSDAATFTDGNDTVVELVGLVDLATSTSATDVVTLV